MLPPARGVPVTDLASVNVTMASKNCLDRDYGESIQSSSMRVVTVADALGTNWSQATNLEVAS